MGALAGIYRYPVKGLSAQPLHEVDLKAGRPFPFDRIFALARSNRDIDADDPKWAKKGSFLMLMLESGLARARTHLDLASMRNGRRAGWKALRDPPIDTRPAKHEWKSCSADSAGRIRSLDWCTAEPATSWTNRTMFCR